MDSHREAFREEANELLDNLESSLLDLEKESDNKELIGRIFRAMHTIKGSGSMFGFDAVAAFTHDLETIYDRVRNGKAVVTKELLDLTLSACDRIRRMVAGNSSDEIEDPVAVEIKAALKNILGEQGGTEVEVLPIRPDSSIPRTAMNSEEMVTYRIRIRPESNILANGTNPLLLLAELRGLGLCRVVAQTEAIPFLSDIDPEGCYTYWDAILTTNQGVNSIKDVFVFVEDNCELKIDAIDGIHETNEGEDYKKLGDILVEKGDVTTDQLREILGSQKRIGELFVESGMVDAGKIEAALVEQQLVRENRQKRQTADSTASIRVPVEKLDSLVNMVGELVTIQSRLSQMVSILNHRELVLIAEEVERLTSELRDNTMSIRMLPIGTTFSRFRRLVRDLSVELGKEIELETEGAETELDKTVIERLNDPLIHLIRNSIDHGIESPSDRLAAGKPRQGKIHLSAVHSGASVLIRVRDDGAGLDNQAIRAKAIERGTINADSNLSEKEIYSLILAPGFSTAKTVTSVSGRGVGMDVVKKSIEGLQGTIEIDSQKGSGTTVTLKLPLTLAIIDGLLVRVDSDSYILPLSIVEEVVELTRGDIARFHGQHLASIRGEIVPYLRLRERFSIEGDLPGIEQIVTTRLDGYRIGLVVDQVIGEHQTVIKSLGRVYREVEEVSGASILGDGKVALILDVPKLIRRAEQDEQRLHDGRSIQ